MTLSSFLQFLIQLKIAIPAIIMEVLIGFALALVLNRKFFGRGFVLALLVTPLYDCASGGGIGMASNIRYALWPHQLLYNTNPRT